MTALIPKNGLKFLRYEPYPKLAVRAAAEVGKSVLLICAASQV